MAQQQLVQYNLGRELVPYLQGNAAAQFGQWVINYARNNPGDIARFTNDAVNWLRDNGAGQQAWALAQSMRERVQDVGPFEAFLGGVGAITGGGVGGPAGAIANGGALAAIGRWADQRGNNGQEVALDSQGEIPDLGGLIPGNTMENASGNGGGTRRPAEGPPDGEPAAQRVASASGPNTVSKETPISPYPTLSFGLQETHTTILPWTGWVTIAMDGTGANQNTPLQLKLRMNTPYDMVDVTCDTDPTAGAAYTTPGFFPSPSQAGGLRAPSGVTYPRQFNGGGTPTAVEKPAWRDYWGALYDYYTVLGCEYKLVIENPNTSTGSAIIIYEHVDTYSDTATSTGNVLPLTNQAEILAFKNVKEHRVAPNDTRQDYITIIEGRYRPGQAKRNIVNDGDVKTWTATGTTLPNLKEILTINFCKHPMAYAEKFNANIQMSLKYIVQYKDLKQQARYPNTATTNQDITLVLNEDNTNNNGLQRWT